MKYKNHIDDIYYVILGTYFSLCLVFSINIIIINASKFYVISGIILILLLCLMFYHIYNRYYVLESKKLIIKIGFLKKEIPYKEIKKSYITQNDEFSYATSKKKIALELKNNKTIFISPEKLDDMLINIIKKAGIK